MNDAARKDKRRKLVDSTMRRYGHSAYALIETLHSVQEAYGYLDDDNLRYVSEALQVPLSKIYGVATFYHFFTLKPQGEHTAVLCTGTACHIKGVPAILSAIKENFDIEAGETTEDNKLSLLTARCIGSCGLSPAMVLDGEIAGQVTPEIVVDRIGRMIKNDT
ncbi:MAG: bidirectional hydrogenase complex protein HoxE [Cyclonatronaceae bacterium]